MDVEDYLKTDNRIIIVTGATEQHSYLSLLTDVRIPERIAEAAIAREKVLLAPPINFGIGDRFLDFPGTINIAESTFAALLTDVINSLIKHGFYNFLIINGHQENRFPFQLEYLDDTDCANIVWFDWWNCEAVHEFEFRHNLRLEHANWSENFAFNRVSPVPEGQADPIGMESISATDFVLREHAGDGNLGGPYQIDDRLMFQLFDRIVDEVIQLLVSFR